MPLKILVAIEGGNLAGEPFALESDGGHSLCPGQEPLAPRDLRGVIGRYGREGLPGRDAAGAAPGVHPAEDDGRLAEVDHLDDLELDLVPVLRPGLEEIHE